MSVEPSSDTLNVASATVDNEQQHTKNDSTDPLEWYTFLLYLAALAFENDAWEAMQFAYGMAVRDRLDEGSAMESYDRAVADHDRCRELTKERLAAWKAIAYPMYGIPYDPVAAPVVPES